MKYALKRAAALLATMAIVSFLTFAAFDLISDAATAMLGTMLSIKPVLHVDNEGHLINMSKARGRQSSIKALVDKAAELAIEPEGQTMFICQGDCQEDAQYLADLVRERFGVKDIHIGYTGPVIGSHSGPGTLALFFLGKER